MIIKTRVIRHKLISLGKLMVIDRVMSLSFVADLTDSIRSCLCAEFLTKKDLTFLNGSEHYMQKYINHKRFKDSNFIPSYLHISTAL
jgi:hypothetical protein